MGRAHISGQQRWRPTLPNTKCENTIICPHCGEWDGDDRYYGEGCYEGLTCNHCEKEYSLTVHVSISYDTTAKAVNP